MSHFLPLLHPSSTKASAAVVPATTEIVWTTKLQTVVKCPDGVTDCLSSGTAVVTSVVDVLTTYCPVSATSTSAVASGIPPGHGDGTGTPTASSSMPPGYGDGTGTPTASSSMPPGYGDGTATPTVSSSMPPGYGDGTGTPTVSSSMPPGYVDGTVTSTLSWGMPPGSGTGTFSRQPANRLRSTMRHPL